MSTILHRLAAWADEEPSAPAQVFKENRKEHVITAREFCDHVYWIALFLESKGISSLDVGAIFSNNCPEWVHFELATQLLGGKSAGIYPNSTPKDIQYILNHTESRFLAVQNKEFFNRIRIDDEAGISELQNRLEFFIVFDGDTSISPKAVSYRTALAQGKKLASKKNSKKLKHYLGKLDPNVGSFLIYTSGTTGRPKGAMLSHDNLTFAVDRILDFWKLPPRNGKLFSFLPLCHIAEKLQNIGGGITNRWAVSFSSGFDQVARELPVVQPTLLLCVPRVWEKMMEGVQKKVDSSSGAKKRVLGWAFDQGKVKAEAKSSGRQLEVSEWLQWKLADQLILSRIRKMTGLAKVKAAASGAAALAPHVSKWFRTLGIEILEVFGQSETSGVISATPPHLDATGTAGSPVPGLELKLAPDGEVLVKGRHVFKGYFRDAEASANCFDSDGWLRTGDLAEWTSSGFLKIRGRKKEIIKTSGGKMVAPVPIEEELKAAPMISQVCMVGEGRKYLSALITLKDAKLQELKKQKIEAEDSIITEPKLMTEVKNYVDQLNTSLASYEQIKRFAVLNREFSIDDGEMTPTLKMKRNIIEDRYKNVIDQLYE